MNRNKLGSKLAGHLLRCAAFSGDSVLQVENLRACVNQSFHSEQDAALGNHSGYQNPAVERKLFHNLRNGAGRIGGLVIEGPFHKIGLKLRDNLVQKRVAVDMGIVFVVLLPASGRMLRGNIPGEDDIICFFAKGRIQKPSDLF